MALADLSIRRPVFAWMLMAALILFGALSFFRLGISQLPDVDFPVIAVNVTYAGAAPEIMETSVVEAIEDALTSIEGLQRITSTSNTGSATVSAEFDLSRNIDLALQDVQAKVEQARRNLPQDIDPPVITKTNPEDQPILWLAVMSDKLPVPELSRYVKDALRPQFSTVEGVGDIRLGGYTEPNLRVWIEPDRLNRYGLTMSDVAAAVQNEHLERPSGYLDYRGREANIRTLGEAATAEDFNHVFINSLGGAPNYLPVPLTRVATVENGLADIRQIARSNGKPAIGLGIQKQRGSNSVAVAQGVRARLAEVQKTLPEGMTIEVRNDSTRFIEESVRELNFTLLLAAILTAIVCWVFLGSWSSTLNVLLAIPTSIVGAFTALYFLGFTLNTFTVLALSLSIGIVVDDAIMVLENIVRHREQGQSRVKSALFGAREITFAATAATVSILAIFLPVAFMRGIIGRFFLQFGITLSVAVLLSLLEALTLTPMRCAQFVEATERKTRFGRAVERTFERLRDGYAWSLARALRHRKLVLAASIGIFVLSLFSVKGLKTEFLPAEDQGQLLLRIKTPIGSSLGATDAIVKQVEQRLARVPEVAGTFASVGGFGSGQVNQAFAFLSLTPKGERRKSQQQLAEELRQELNQVPGAQVVVQDLSLRSFTSSRGFPVEFTIQGPEWEGLWQQTQGMIGELRKSGLVVDLDTDYQPGAPELDIIPDRARAQERGVPVALIAETANIALGGYVAGKFNYQGRRYDVRLKMAEPPEGRERLTPRQRIERLMIRNNRGNLIPFTDVVQIRERQAATTLTRYNRQRAITVYANIAPGKSQGEALNLVQQLGQRLPTGYRLQLTGSSETFRESFQSLMVALVLGLAVAYMVLASQFNRFSDPVSVLSALPFSLTGAFLALLIGGQTLNIYSMIGLILLMGIVKKNSILLVEFTNQVRAHDGLGVLEALQKACPIRLRPILMTSIAVIAGALPAAVAFGPGAESRKPMAIATIGGVLVSSVLTLFVVPCLYSLITSRKTELGVETELRKIEDEEERAALERVRRLPPPTTAA